MRRISRRSVEILIAYVDGKYISTSNSGEKNINNQVTRKDVAKHFGVDWLASSNYVALHGADAAMILKYLERISSSATEIIKALENDKEPVLKELKEKGKSYLSPYINLSIDISHDLSDKGLNTRFAGCPEERIDV